MPYNATALVLKFGECGLLLGPLSTGVVVPVRVLSMGQIEQISLLKRLLCSELNEKGRQQYSK